MTTKTIEEITIFLIENCLLTLRLSSHLFVSLLFSLPASLLNS